RLRKVTSDGTISTVAVNVYATALACDRGGNVYATEYGEVRKFMADGSFSVIAGTGTPGFSGDGGPATSAMLNSTQGITVDGQDNVYISDTNNNRVRKILAAPPSLSVVNPSVSISGVSQGPPVSANITVSSSTQGFHYSIAFASTGGNWLGV